jgi:hypothetical protein
LQFFILIETPINDRDRVIGIAIVIGKNHDDDNPARAPISIASCGLQDNIFL